MNTLKWTYREDPGPCGEVGVTRHPCSLLLHQKPFLWSALGAVSRIIATLSTPAVGTRSS